MPKHNHSGHRTEGIVLENINIEQHNENRKIGFVCNFMIIILGVYGTFECFWTCIGKDFIEGYFENENQKWMIVVILLVVVVAITYVVMIRTMVWVAMVVTLPIALIGMLVGYVPDTLPVIALMMFLIAIVAIDERHSKIISLSAGVIVLVVYVCVSFAIPQEKYTRIKAFDTVREKIEHIYKKDVIQEKIEEQFDTVAVGGINDGKLGAYDKVEYTGRTMLTFTTGSFKRVVYLKSYVGAVYNNNSWDELKENVTFIQPRNTNINMYNQTAELLAILDGNEELIQRLYGDVGTYEKYVFKRKFHVQYELAGNKYWYLPYASSMVVNDKSAFDGYPIGNPNSYINSYAYELIDEEYGTYKNFVDNYTGVDSKMRAYKRWEAAYRKFVNRAYVQIPDNFSSPVVFHGNREQYVEDVKIYFENNFIYTVSPGKIPEDKDFVDYFLNETKQGYCTYFATAATLMFRAAGIPARYVEGYAVELDDDTILLDTKVTSERMNPVLYSTDTYHEYCVSVKDNSAHAWVEIYEDGYGWVPVEVTVGRTAQSAVNENYSDTQVVLYDRNKTSVDNAGSMDDSDMLGDEDSDISQHQMQKENHNGFDRMVRAFTDLFVVIVWIASISSIIWLLLYMIARRAERKNDELLQIPLLYKLFEKMCSFVGLKRNESMGYMEYAVYIKTKSVYFENADIEFFVQKVLKETFSKDKTMTSQEDIRKIKKMLSAISIQIYGNCNIFKKFLYRYIYHLYLR